MKFVFYFLTKFLMLAFLSVPCFASSDSQWTLLAHEPEMEMTGSGVGVAYLHPRNDTRINMLLLMQDMGLATQQQPKDFELTDKVAPFFLESFDEKNPATDQIQNNIRTQLEKLKVDDELIRLAFIRLNHWHEGRCVSDSWGSLQQFLNQIEAAGLVQSELQALALARLKLAGSCPDSKFENIESLSSQTSKDFALYLNSAAMFYAGNFKDASELFRQLSEAKTLWVQETAYYMMGRVYLNLAQQNAVDSWGLFEKDAINKNQLDNASLAFNEYLKKYPHGVYAPSAKGLARKIAWLGKSQLDLAASYSESFKDALSDTNKTPSALELLYEVDNHYWFSTAESENLPNIYLRDPLWQIPEIAAIAVLARQRVMREYEVKSGSAPYALAPEKIKSSFIDVKKASQEKLGRYLLLSHQFFVKRDYASVLDATANLEVAEKISNLDFSFLYLRGLAFEKTKQHESAYKIWRGLASKSKSHGMRMQSQIALAIHLSENNKLLEAFSENSLITYDSIRKPLIANSADATVLENIVKSSHTLPAEKREALFQLIFKNLQNQRYAEILRLIAAYPEIYERNNTDDNSETSLVHELKEYVDHPNEAMALVNLASRYQYYRENQVDYAAFEGHVGGYIAKWEGESKSSLELYQKVMQEPTASYDAKAKAISGAINCFRRTGANHCDDQQITPSERKSWFTTLKKKYGKSSWAQEQKYYW